LRKGEAFDDTTTVRRLDIVPNEVVHTRLIGGLPPNAV
jgi:hypothetical protein